MLPRRIPGTVGGRPARTFVIASADYLAAETGFGLGANDPFYMTLWARRAAATATMDIFHLGRSGSNNDRRGMITSTNTLVVLTRNAGGSTVQAVAAGAPFQTSSGWVPVIGEFASDSSRRIIVSGAATSNTTTNTLTNAPNRLVVASPIGTPAGAFTGALTAMAIFGGTASDSLIAMHGRGVHPTLLPGALLECWDLDRVGPIVGLVRGTVLSPVNGGALTWGPTQAQGPPRRVRMPVGDVFGGTPAATRAYCFIW